MPRVCETSGNRPNRTRSWAHSETPRRGNKENPQKLFMLTGKGTDFLGFFGSLVDFPSFPLAFPLEVIMAIPMSLPMELYVISLRLKREEETSKPKATKPTSKHWIKAILAIRVKLLLRERDCAAHAPWRVYVSDVISQCVRIEEPLILWRVYAVKGGRVWFFHV